RARRGAFTATRRRGRRGLTPADLFASDELRAMTAAVAFEVALRAFGAREREILKRALERIAIIRVAVGHARARLGRQQISAASQEPERRVALGAHLTHRDVRERCR